MTAIIPASPELALLIGIVIGICAVGALLALPVFALFALSRADRHQLAKECPDDE